MALLDSDRLFVKLSGDLQERWTIYASQVQLGRLVNLRVVLSDGAGVSGVVVRLHETLEKLGRPTFACEAFPTRKLLAADKRTKEVQPTHERVEILLQVAVVLAPYGDAL